MERPPLGLISGAVNDTKKQASRTLRKTMTPAEHILWEKLRDRRLDGLRFRRQVVLRGFIVDFYCHHRSLVVEVDGPIHNQQANYDEDRDRALAALGLRVLRIPNADVRARLPATLLRISQAARSPQLTS